VLVAFGAVGLPRPLTGGTGSSWRSGSLVLKPLDCAEREISWQAQLFAAIEQDGFRVAAPLPDVVDGWTATPFLDARHEHGRWRDIIAVGERFHAALAGVPRPDAIIDQRTNPWAIGDRVAWGERPYDGIDDLLAALEPVDAPSQLVHGDLTGNVLFHDELPPAIIDFAPYWHPTEYATRDRRHRRGALGGRAGGSPRRCAAAVPPARTHLPRRHEPRVRNGRLAPDVRARS